MPNSRCAKQSATAKVDRRDRVQEIICFSKQEAGQLLSAAFFEISSEFDEPQQLETV